MHRALRLKKPLLATMNSAPWKDIKLTNREKRAVKDIENNQLWQNFYIIMRTTYPALRVLRAADSNQACMDKL